MGPKGIKPYNPKWEQDPVLKTWIARDDTNLGKAVCNFCRTAVRAHKNDLMEHTKTRKHQENFMRNSTPEEYNNFVKELNELKKRTDKTDASRKEWNELKKRTEKTYASRKKLNELKKPTEKTDTSRKGTSKFGTTNSTPNPVSMPCVNVIENSEVNATTMSSANSNEKFFNLNDSSSNGTGELVAGIDLRKDAGESELFTDFLPVVLEEEPFSGVTSTTTSRVSNSCRTVKDISGRHMSLRSSAPSSSKKDNFSFSSSNGTNITSLKQQNNCGTKEKQYPLTAGDVIKSVKDGHFTLHELSAITKAASAQMDALIHSTLKANYSTDN